MRPALLLLSLALSLPTAAQWTIQDSHSTASLRGIQSLGNGVAWASGSNGTVLRTVDSGINWQTCAVPPGAEKLDFRGVQAFDEKTAIVMSSGKGDLSRLYKTIDGCGTWKLLFTNPDKDGFWDAIQFKNRSYGVLLGDPVGDRFYARETRDGGVSWKPFADDEMIRVGAQPAGIFAASNSSLVLTSLPITNHSQVVWAIANVGNKTGVYEADFGSLPCRYPEEQAAKLCPKAVRWGAFASLPILRTGDSSGAFALAMGRRKGDWNAMVVVGGDYQDSTKAGSAAYNTIDDDEARAEGWKSSTTPPHGYRSALTYDPTHKLWITVGPNGTDISFDDGRNWRPLRPTPSEAPDADQHWNALSLPFVVGAHGRIGVLRPDALKQP